MYNRNTSEQRERGPVVVSLASPEDALAIVKIQAEVWLQTYPNEALGITKEDILAKNLANPLRAERWRKTIESTDKGYRVWVAKDGGDVIGYCLAKRGEQENYVDALYLLAEYQGKGVAQQLMAEAFAWLGSAKPIGLGVVTYNARAIAFYRKLGFRESTESPEPVPPLPSGRILPVVKMIKRAEGSDTI